MQEREPMTKTLKASEARQQFSELLNQVFKGETRVLVEKSGIPVAAIVSPTDLNKLQQLESQQSERFKLLERLRTGFADLSEEQIQRAVTEIIEKQRQQERSKHPSPNP
jgi:prevent-host-death family protein